MNLNCPWQSKIIMESILMSLPQALRKKIQKETKETEAWFWRALRLALWSLRPTALRFLKLYRLPSASLYCTPWLPQRVCVCVHQNVRDRLSVLVHSGWDFLAPNFSNTNRCEILASRVIVASTYIYSRVLTLKVNVLGKGLCVKTLSGLAREVIGWA